MSPEAVRPAETGPAPATSTPAWAIPDWAIDAIIAAGRRMDQRGWVPATAGNISVRLDADRFAITRSGNHKGFLEPSDVMQIAVADTRPLGEGKPSAETGLHAQVYRIRPDVGAVVHGHSVANTVVSLMAPEGRIRFTGFEILKAFEGVTTHDTSLDLPVFPNDQDIARLAGVVEPYLRRGMPLGYAIAGHGVYIWGPTMTSALARLEGLEFLLACELERRKLVT